MSQISLKRIIKQANDLINPDTSTLDGLKTYVTSWYCLKYNVSFKDPLLLSHSFEELLLLYYMNILSENEELSKKLLDDNYKTEEEEYEEWLQKQMGDSYVSEEEMINDIETHAKQEEEIAKQLPDDLSIDFNNLGLEDG